MTSATEPARPLTEPELRREVANGIRRAAEQQLNFALVACVPMHLPADDAERLLGIAAGCVRGHVRGDDVVGTLDEGAIVIGATDTDMTEAAVLAHRVRNELELQAHNLRHSVWDTGIAQLDRDGTTAEELFDVALAAARGRRRNLANAPSPVAHPDVTIRRD